MRHRLITPHVRRSVLNGKVIDLHRVEAAALADSLDQLASGVVIVDATGRIIHANASAHRLIAEGNVHFSHALRRTTGAAPHNCPLARRVEVAKEKLRDGRLSLLDVALVCGFADQSHFTRIFARIVGVSPGAWRRALE